MPEAAPYLAICIPTYNRSAYLKTCLQSVIAEISDSRLQEEVVVIISDNASIDDTAQVVIDLQSTTNVQLQYSCNPENVGAVNNFIRLTEISTATYTYILGDDDELVKGALSKVLQVIKDHPGSLVHHYKCVQTDFIPAGMPATLMDVYSAATTYFYNIGNAGTFLFHTAKAQAIVKKKKALLATTCWPQTEIMFSMLMEEKDKAAFVVSGIEFVNSDSHNENVIYNSWYIVETFCFSLLRISQRITRENNDQRFMQAAKKAIPACQAKIKFFFRFILFITYYDYAYELTKTKVLLLENRHILSGSNLFYPLVYRFLLALPGFAGKWLTAVYFFASFPSLKRSTFDKQYAAVKEYQRNKYELYKRKGKLTGDEERYIY